MKKKALQSIKIIVVSVAAAALLLAGCGESAATAGSSAASSAVSTSSVKTSSAKSGETAAASASSGSETKTSSSSEGSGTSAVSSSSVTEQTSSSSESTASSSSESTASSSSETPSGDISDGMWVTDDNAPEIPGLVYEHSMYRQYADQFQVHYYEGGYKLLDVANGDRFLMVPDGGTVPDGLSNEFTILQLPLDNIYVAATASMALFSAIDALDNIKFSSVKASGWYVDAAVEAMEAGDMLFAGKYSEPDYELLLSDGCDLALESTMIYHTPKVKEMLETLGIPVAIEYSTYESSPLGRVEWVKAFSSFVDKEEEAFAFFADQAKIMDELENYEKTDKTVAYFYLSTEGMVIVRNTTDYIPKMIDMAGANYVCNGMFDDTVTGVNVSISMEQFYDVAMDADYLIYNASIDSSVTSVDALIAKDQLFKDFKAVKEGNVWTTGKSMYQSTDKLAQFITDIHLMITDGSEDDMVFLTKM